jgi:predicted small lipoprotein YifL
MKRAVVIFLALVMCVTMCACGGHGELASPGSANGETSANGGTATTDGTATEGSSANGGTAQVNSDGTPVTDGTQNGNAEGDPADQTDPGSTDNVNGGNNGAGNNTGNSGNTGRENALRPSLDTTDKAPENSQTYTYTVNGKDVTVSYGTGMTASESNGVLCIDYGSQKYYLEDVTDFYTGDPSTFLYQYAYTYAIQRVNSAFGDVSDFDGEVVMNGTGNVVMGYAGTMTCSGSDTVYAFVKLIQLDKGGYAVATGICDGNNATVFDNIQVS